MASGMPPRVANRNPCAVLVSSPASHSPPNGIPIHRAALPSTTATASSPVTASARDRRSSCGCASTLLGPNPADTRAGEAGRRAAGRHRLGRRASPPRLQVRQAAGAPRRAARRARGGGPPGRRVQPRDPLLRAGRRLGGETALESSGLRGGGGRRTSAASSAAIWRWSSCRVAAPAVGARAATNVPRPCSLLTRPSDSSRAYTARTVLTFTPAMSASSRTLGSRSPGTRVPSSTAVRMRPASCAPSGVRVPRSTLRSSSPCMRAWYRTVLR